LAELIDIFFHAVAHKDDGIDFLSLGFGNGML
jgi:hypothetical protein